MFKSSLAAFLYSTTFMVNSAVFQFCCLSLLVTVNGNDLQLDYTAPRQANKNYYHLNPILNLGYPYDGDPVHSVH